MAIEQERMVVVLEARLDKLEKGFAKARATGAATMAGIVTDATKMESALSRVGSGGFDRAARSASNLKLQTGNLAAQFNDIGVQLAGGQSPFLIALQQGTQITQALGPSGAGGAVKALGGAFLSLLNPLSLATIAVIGLGGSAVQALVEWYSSGAKTEEQLKQQAALIRDVAAKWGEVVPALQAYIAELDKAKEKADLIAAGEAFREDRYAPAKDALVEVNAQFAEFVSLLQTSETDAAKIFAVQEAFETLKDRIAANKAEADDAKAVQDALNQTFLAGSDAAQPLFSALDALIIKLRGVSGAANAVDQGISKILGGGDRVGELDRSLTDLPLPNTVSETPERRVDPYFDGPSGGGGSKRDAAAEAAKREAQAVAELIEQLEFELSIVNLSEQAKEVAIAQRRAGTAATEVQKLKIAELTQQIYAEEQAIKANKDAQEALADAGEYAFGLLEDGLSGVIDGSVSAEDAVKKLAVQLAIAAAQAALLGTGPLAGLLGGGLGSSLISPTLFSYASGTNNHPGGLARINERGGEIVNLPNGTQVIPHDVSVKALRGSASGSITAPITFAPTIQSSGNAAADQAMLAELRKMQREFTGNVVRSLKEIKIKGLA